MADLPRVMRVPGYLHLKGGTSEYVLLDEIGPQYSARQVLEGIKELPVYDAKEKKVVPVTLAELRNTLSFVDPTFAGDYNKWIGVCLCIMDLLIEPEVTKEERKTTLINWCSGALWNARTGETGTPETWNGEAHLLQEIKNPRGRGKKTTFGTIAKYAMENGWISPKKEKNNELAMAIRRVDKKMGSLISYDEFSYRPRWITADRPWPTHSDDFTETDMVLLAADIGFSTARTVEALRAFRAFHRHHPVRDYLDGIKWDGTPRLNRLLPDYFHSEDTAYAQQAGRKLLMAAVARVYIPGCKSDYTVVLEGEQGAKKSSGVEALCPNQEWFLDNLGDISRDQQVGQRMAGKWIIEIAELASFSKSEIDMLKAFMTRKDDRFREPYDRNDTSHLRQSAFFGTINTKDDSGYLIDETGNRRFWPLMVKNVDVDAIKRDRDQLWAEAVVAFRSGEKWYFTDADVIASAAAAQEERVVADVWLDPIANKVLGVAKERLVSDQKEIVVTAAYVLEHWLDIKPKDMKQADKNKVTKCLKALVSVRKLVESGESDVIQGRWLCRRDRRCGPLKPALATTVTACAIRAI